MTAETSNARGELRVADIREDAREPLQLLREKLAHDEDGWAALCRLMPMLAADPPPADAEVRARELLAACAGSAHVAEIIRSNPFAGGLIHIEHALRAIVAALSQQPEARVYQCPRCATSMEVDPTAKPEARGGGEVFGWVLGNAFVDARFWTGDTPPQGWTPVYCTAPTGAPVGALGQQSGAVAPTTAECPHDWGQDEAHEDWARCYKCGISRRKTLDQQSAAADRARFRKAPCYLCGYNGAGYFQPETHPCAALYHAAQPGGFDNDR